MLQPSSTNHLNSVLQGKLFRPAFALQEASKIQIKVPELKKGLMHS